MSHYQAAYTHPYLVVCSSMHGYLVGLEALDISFVLEPVYRITSCALGHNNGSEMYASIECPGETVYLPKLV